MKRYQVNAVTFAVFMLDEGEEMAGDLERWKRVSAQGRSIICFLIHRRENLHYAYK